MPLFIFINAGGSGVYFLSSRIRSSLLLASASKSLSTQIGPLHGMHIRGDVRKVVAKAMCCLGRVTSAVSRALAVPCSNSPCSLREYSVKGTSRALPWSFRFPPLQYRSPCPLSFFLSLPEVCSRMESCSQSAGFRAACDERPTLKAQRRVVSETRRWRGSIGRVAEGMHRGDFGIAKTEPSQATR